jgi:hypothetical protein
MKEYKMCIAYRKMKERNYAYRNLVWKPEGNKAVGKQRSG